MFDQIRLNLQAPTAAAARAAVAASREAVVLSSEEPGWSARCAEELLEGGDEGTPPGSTNEGSLV